MARRPSGGPRHAVLSDTLVAAINERRVKAAVFTTFTFDPGFFESHVLPCLFSRAWGTHQNVKRFQLCEELRQLEQVCVYYDRNGLITGRDASYGLDYVRIDVAHRKGVFHAKHILLLVENVSEDDEGEPWDSLIVMTSSANLTREGWLRAVEVAHVCEIEAGDSSSFRNDLLSRGRSAGLLKRLEEADQAGARNSALELIHDFLIHEVEQRRRRPRKDASWPKFYVGREPFAEFVRRESRMKSGDCRLEIISPFLDSDGEDTTALDDLVSLLEPRETLIYLPRDESGDISCSEAYFDKVASMDNVRWADLPGELTRFSKKETDAGRRFVHAKVYRLFTLKPKREVIVAGSPNLTRAGHFPRNFETAVLVETNVPRTPDWWMRPMEGRRPANFGKLGDEPSRGDGHPVSLRYRWGANELLYFWVEPKTRPQQAQLSCGGAPVGTAFTPTRFGEWAVLPVEAADRAREVLASTAFLELSVDGGEAQAIMVREEEMERKPWRLEEKLSAEEILEYWSLLEPERRDAFLERKILQLLEQAQLAEERETTRPEDGSADAEPESMFDRFAGIFHAFSCLEERVMAAIDEENPRHKEAAYLLLGQGLDSLPSLVRRVAEDESGDPVRRYVTVLCAQGLVDKILRSGKPFVKDRAQGAYRKQLSDLGQDAKQVARQTKKGLAGTSSEFFEWFEQEFHREVDLPIGMETAL